MVQRLPSPGILPTSQEAGGMVHDQRLAMTAPGTPPGYDGGSYSYPASTDVSEQPPGQSGATIPVTTQPVTGPGSPPASSGPYPDRGSTGQPRMPSGMTEGGQWATGDPDESPWKKTPAAS